MSEKFVLITGASKGLGKLLAQYLAHLGYNLCLISRNEVLLRELSTKLSSETGKQVIPIVCDLSDQKAVEKLIPSVKSSVPVSYTHLTLPTSDLV